MNSNAQEAVETLNKLIEVCLDGELGYRTAARHIHNPKLRTVLTDYAIRRAQFVEELRSEVERLGGIPSDSGSMAASLHRGWIALKSAISHGDPAAIVAACATGEESALGSYRAAASSDVVGQTRTLIEKQWEAVEQAYGRLQRMKAQVGPGGEYSATAYGDPP